MRSPLSAVIIGCGLIASRWVRTFLQDGRITVAALVDPDSDRATALAAKYGLDLEPHARLETALEQTKTDIAVNLAPPHQHAAISASALSAGLHVLSEKPLTTSLHDAERLVALAAAHGRYLAVMDNRGLETQPFADQVRAHLPGPYLVTAETVAALPTPGFRDNLADAVTIDLAVHAFDQIRRIVPARAERLHRLELDTGTAGNIFPWATFTISFSDGSVFNYRGGFAHAPYATPATGHWRVDHPTASLAWDGNRRITTTTRNTPPDTRLLPETAPGYQRAITAMIDTLANGGPYPAPDLTPIALLDAALQNPRPPFTTITGDRS